MIKLTKTTTGYTADIDGYRFAICKQDKGWNVKMREIAVTAGVEHTLGQPVITEDFAEKLSDVRGTLMHFAAEGDTIANQRYGKALNAWQDSDAFWI